jgi:hypothetical protein
MQQTSILAPVSGSTWAPQAPAAVATSPLVRAGSEPSYVIAASAAEAQAVSGPLQQVATTGLQVSLAMHLCVSGYLSLRSHNPCTSQWMNSNMHAPTGCRKCYQGRGGLYQIL